MSEKRNISIASLLLAAFLPATIFAKPAADCGCTNNYAAQEMRNMTTQELVRDMGLGVNLGNTFESQSSNVNNIETAWGSPRITQEIIRVYPTVGFKTVRVPVRWTNAMSEDHSGGSYAINPVLMDRVQEVVDWILDEGMYVILNIHHEGWITTNMPNDSAETMRKYKRIWEQVADRFKDYGDKLMFEGLNEEGHWDDVWYVWNNGSDLAAKSRVYGFLKTLNQSFVDIVRASGRNNGDRHLLVSGYDTNIDRTIDPYFEMPNDPRSGGARLAVSVHYYDPFCFTHGSPTDNWDWCGGVTTRWGTQTERNNLNNDMNKLKTNLVDQGIPVIVGEYGAAWEGRRLPQDTVRDYTLSVAEAIYSRQMLPVLWDTQLDPSNNEPIYYFDRRANPPAYPDQELVAGFRQIAGSNIVTSVRQSGSRSVQAQASVRPHVSVRGQTLNVTSSSSDASTAAMNVRLIDVKGKVRASFNAVGGNGVFSLARVPAGRYFVEVRGVGGRYTTPVTLR